MTIPYIRHYLFIPLLMLGISACQPSANTHPSKHSTNEIAQKKVSTELPIPQKDANQISAVPSRTLDIATQGSSKTEVQPLTTENQSNIIKSNTIETKAIMNTERSACNRVFNAMAKVDNTSKVDDIYRVNNMLPACLEQTDTDTAFILLKKYNEMYSRFLDDGLDTLDDMYNFGDFVYRLNIEKTVKLDETDIFSPRQNYLLQLSQADDDVYLKYLGEGFYTFSHDLQKMVALFAPYLAIEDRLFFERMAKDNQEIFWNDAAINVPFNDLIDRAVYWENYLKQYPNGRHNQEAKHLYNVYRYSIFFGSDNTDWTDDAMHYFFEPEDNLAMIDLSHKPKSQLAKDAKKFLKFMQTSDTERRGSIKPNGNDYQDISIARQRADEIMQIPNPWKAEESIDCFSGIFCR